MFLNSARIPEVALVVGRLGFSKATVPQEIFATFACRVYLRRAEVSGSHGAPWQLCRWYHIITQGPYLRAVLARAEAATLPAESRSA